MDIEALQAALEQANLASIGVSDELLREIARERTVLVVTHAEPLGSRVESSTSATALFSTSHR